MSSLALSVVIGGLFVLAGGAVLIAESLAGRADGAVAKILALPMITGGLALAAVSMLFLLLGVD